MQADREYNWSSERKRGEKHGVTSTDGPTSLLMEDVEE